MSSLLPSRNFQKLHTQASLQGEGVILTMSKKVTPLQKKIALRRKHFEIGVWMRSSTYEIFGLALLVNKMCVTYKNLYLYTLKGYKQNFLTC